MPRKPRMKIWTVVGLYPSYSDHERIWEGSFVAQVDARTPLDAVEQCRIDRADGCEIDPEDREEWMENVEILAIFPGRHQDQFDPWAAYRTHLINHKSATAPAS